MDMLKAFRAYLVITLGFTQAQAEAKVPDGTEDFTAIMGDITNAHKAKVNTQKEEYVSQGFNKGKLEILGKFEDEVRTKFGVASKKSGLELIDEVIAAKTPDPGNPDSIAPDVIKKHPAYLERERTLSNELAEAKAETDKKVKEVQDTYAAKETFGKVSESFLTKFRGLNPILPEDKEKAARQEARLIKELEGSGYVFQLQEGQDPLILERNADGSTKRKEDEHGHPLKWDDFVRSTADGYGFEFKAGEPRTTPGSGNPLLNTQPPIAGAKYTGKQPTNEAEYMAIITDPKLPVDQKGEVQDAWEAKNAPKTS
jgi:hypothetical protein